MKEWQLDIWEGKKIEVPTIQREQQEFKDLEPEDDYLEFEKMEPCKNGWWGRDIDLENNPHVHLLFASKNERKMWYLSGDFDHPFRMSVYTASEKQRWYKTEMTRVLFVMMYPKRNNTRVEEVTLTREEIMANFPPEITALLSFGYMQVNSGSLRAED